MKSSAIIRIILYSLLILLLLGILLTGLGLGSFLFNINTGNNDYTTGQGTVDVTGISNLSIDWAAGSITIKTAQTDQITFTESGDSDEKYTMVYSQKGDTLTIEYAMPTVVVGFNSIPSKDLTVTVPSDWFCDELELDGAAVEMDVSGLSVGTLDLDGAAGKVRFNGYLDKLECDCAAVELDICCTNAPSQIDIDGASCQLNLTLPEGSGFLVQMDGLGCHFNSDVECNSENGTYFYGDRACHLNVDGLGCDIGIYYAQQNPRPTATEN